MSRRNEKATTERKTCIECEKDKLRKDFYNSNHPMLDGKSPICTTCVGDKVNYEDIESVHTMLKLLDIPFDITHWKTAVEKGGNVFGVYVRMANSLKQFRGLSWKDSIFEVGGSGNQPQIGEYLGDSGISPESYRPSGKVIDKWGFGYEADEYYYFERKYDTMKNNYSQRTSMHTEALLNYIRYQVKAELATAKGDVKAAKDWGSLAKDAATAAKINPSQLSQADLSDGLDSFSQLVRSVEQAVDIIEILPRFKERPKDKVDFTIWCYINYIRDLKGLPMAEYSDIYAFYEERKKEYEKMVDVEVDDDGIL